jgi:tRNA A-37 threonylcarbamoyl transferase component Bud32
MHRSGVWHADLQAKNLLVVNDSPYVIDLDQSRVGSPVGTMQRNRNLLRFRRSLEKSGFPGEYFELFMAGYGGEHAVFIPVWLEKAYRLRGLFSNLVNSGRNRA